MDKPSSGVVLMTMIEGLSRELISKDPKLLNKRSADVFLCLHLLLANASTHNVEDYLKNCVKLSAALKTGKVSMDCATIFTDMSELVYRFEIGEERDFSDEAWLNFLEVIENTLSHPSLKPEKLLSFDSMPIVAHVYSHILLLVQSQRSNEVRLRAISSIKSLLECSNTALCCETHKMHAFNASCFSKILPGFSQALFTAIVGEKGRNSVVKANALAVLAKLVIVCYGNKTLSAIKSLNKETLERLQLQDYHASVVNGVSHLGKLINQCIWSILSGPVDYSVSARKRLFCALSAFASDILRECWTCLNDISEAHLLRDQLVRSLIVIAVDEQCSAFAKASDCLSELSVLRFSTLSPPELAELERIGVPGRVFIERLALDLLEDASKELDGFLRKYPDENLCGALLDRMRGILLFLGADGIARFVECEATLESHFRTLCKYLQPDLDAFRVSENISSLIAETAYTYSTPTQLFRKYFVHFRNPATLSRIEKAVSALACSHLNFDVASQTLLKLLNSDVDLEVPSLQLLSACILGLSFPDDQPIAQRVSLVSSLLDELFQRNILQMFNTNCDRSIVQWPAVEQPIASNVSSLSPTIKERKSQILKACVTMELLSTASRVWRPSREGDSVYPEELQPFILQMLGLATDDDLLSSTAQTSLNRIASNCGYGRFEDFISAASGPVLSSLTLDFHAVLLAAPQDNVTPMPREAASKLEAACSALSYFVEHANHEAIQRIRPLVMQMLMCMDLTYDFAAAAFLPVLRKIMGTCFRLTRDDDAPSPVCAQTPALPAESTNTQPKSSYLELLLNRRTSKTVLTACINKALANTLSLVASTRRQHKYAYADSLTTPEHPPTTEEEPTQKEDENGEKPKVYPDQIRLVEEIMLRSIHLMSCESPRLRVSSMSLLCDGCGLLRDHEDLLLPLVHKIWSPLIARMRDRHPAVVEKAFELFSVLASVSGTFIRSRATSDLIGALVTFLERGASVSAGAPSSFECLTACRVQRRLLYAFGPICVQLELFSVTLKPIVELLCTYLEKNQPSTLREAAACSLWTLCDLDPGLVLFELDKRNT
uniref:Non-specific serine/threonine protein kinase n=1 Tax=Mesocestoides corti TaxID=53468 RepID=A0A5K3ET00_MESCO